MPSLGRPMIPGVVDATIRSPVIDATSSLLDGGRDAQRDLPPDDLVVLAGAGRPGCGPRPGPLAGLLPALEEDRRHAFVGTQRWCDRRRSLRLARPRAAADVVAIAVETVARHHTPEGHRAGRALGGRAGADDLGAVTFGRPQVTAVLDNEPLQRTLSESTLLDWVQLHANIRSGAVDGLWFSSPPSTGAAAPRSSTSPRRGQPADQRLVPGHRLPRHPADRRPRRGISRDSGGLPARPARGRPGRGDLAHGRRGTPQRSAEAGDRARCLPSRRHRH